MKFLPIAIICALVSATSVTAHDIQGPMKENTSTCKDRTDEECKEPECRRIENKILGRADGKPFHESNAPIIWGFNYCEDPNSREKLEPEKGPVDEPVDEFGDGLGDEPKGGLVGNSETSISKVGTIGDVLG